MRNVVISCWNRRISGIKVVITSPDVSKPRDNGVTSNRSKFVFADPLPLNIAA